MLGREVRRAWPCRNAGASAPAIAARRVKLFEDCRMVAPIILAVVGVGGLMQSRAATMTDLGNDATLKAIQAHFDNHAAGGAEKH